MTHPEFSNIVRLTKHKITRTINQKDLWMVSKNKWLRKDPSADGIKTGWTIPAGHCYVGSATRHGFRVITVVLHSEHWQEDHQKMLRWAFDNFDRDFVNPPGAEFKIAAKTIDGKPAYVTLAKPTFVLQPKGDAPLDIKYTFQPLPSLANSKDPNVLDEPVNAGDLAGKFIISAPGVSYSREAVALNAYKPQSKLLRKSFSFAMPTVMIGGVLAGGALAMRRKARRMFNGRIGTP
jgi:D-alanyl-D-alanine carboxypeptidase (penicillin-binding protein 5/6)